MNRYKRMFIATTGCAIVVTTMLAPTHAIKPGAFESTSPDHGTVHALFNLHHLETAPLPSDIFTVADFRHNTGRRVSLPYPDCAVRVSDCEDLDVINTLDGFGLQSRISIPFDGPIDATTATSETVFLIRLGSTMRRVNLGSTERHGDDDENQNAADQAGQPVGAATAFRRFRQAVRGDYKHALLEAIHAARRSS